MKATEQDIWLLTEEIEKLRKDLEERDEVWRERIEGMKIDKFDIGRTNQTSKECVGCGRFWEDCQCDGYNQALDDLLNKEI